MRVCKLCSVNKDTDEYYYTNKTRGYLDTVCKECRRAQARAYRAETEEDKRRRVESRVYKSKDPEYRSRYYQENKERIKERVKLRAIDKKQEIAKWYKGYAERNREQLSAYKTAHYHRNKDAYKYRAYVRKMQIKESPMRASKSDIDSIKERFKNSCALTGSADIHLDHFIPIATGFGDTSVANIIPLDKKLNLSKSASNPFEWIKTRDDIDLERFNDVVFYLAELNGFTPEEYEAHVYNCFD